VLTWRQPADVAQLVEHNLAKVGVAGSNPVVRSKKTPGQTRPGQGRPLRHGADPGPGAGKGGSLAARWMEVDLDAGEMHISASISDGGPKVGVIRKSTKRSDWRDVPLTSGAVDALRRQHARRRGLGGEPAASDYVFPASFDGAVPMRPDALSNRWAAARGTSEMRLLHLRHFAVAAMLDARESYRTVADILGNSESTLRLHYDGRTDVGKRRRYRPWSSARRSRGRLEPETANVWRAVYYGAGAVYYDRLCGDRQPAKACSGGLQQVRDGLWR
jgi:hypothetical protein